MEYGQFQGLPIWDRKIADYLQFLQPVVQVLLLMTAALVICAAFKLRPAMQVLFLVFLWSP